MSSAEAPPDAIPSAGADMRHLLDQQVVIDGAKTEAPTGAQAIEPTHSPRTPIAGRAPQEREMPRRALLRPESREAGSTADLQREVEQFLYLQAELLDGKHWQAWIDQFAADGIYWMPVAPEQTEWESSPSIFIEDKLLMEIRKNRISHPNAWSQAPQWETNHLVSHVAIESVDAGTIAVRSRFHMMELRRDVIRHFGGSYRHTLARGDGGELRIRLQRVDLFNGQASFDYMLQIWC